MYKLIQTQIQIQNNPKQTNTYKMKMKSDWHLACWLVHIQGMKSWTRSPTQRLAPTCNLHGGYIQGTLLVFLCKSLNLCVWLSFSSAGTQSKLNPGLDGVTFGTFMYFIRRFLTAQAWKGTGRVPCPLLATHQQRDLEVMLLQVLPQLLLLIGTRY